MTHSDMNRGQAIAYLKEDIHNLNRQAEDDEYAQSLMVDLQEKLLEILEPSEWWAEFSDDCDDYDDAEGLHCTAYAYIPHMEPDALDMLLWSLHRLTNAELLQIADVFDNNSMYDYSRMLQTT